MSQPATNAHSLETQRAVLPPTAYRDPARFLREMAALFHPAWTPAITVESLSLPGDYAVTQVNGESVVIVRDEAGIIQAFSNVCRHRGGPVAMGTGNRRSLQCGYHGWTYRLDGRLLNAPECETMPESERMQACLPRFETAVAGPLVFVRLSPGGQSFERWISSIVERCGRDPFAGQRSAVRRLYTVQCNWKTYVENFLEGYHIPIVHPALYRLLDYDAYRTDAIDGGAVQVAPLREGDDGALYFWIFPGFMLNVYPESVSLNLVIPRSPTTTDVLFEWYSPDPNDPVLRAELENAVERSDLVQREDVAVCESVASGLASRYFTRGGWSPPRENGIWLFHRMLEDRLTPAPDIPNL